MFPLVLYCNEAWSVPLRGDAVKVSIQDIFGHKKDKVRSGILNNEKRRVNGTTSIIKTMKSRRLR
jgi:hypothetical protein